MSSARSSTSKQSAVEPSKYTWTIEDFKDLTEFEYAPQYIEHSKYNNKFILNCHTKLETCPWRAANKKPRKRQIFVNDPYHCNFTLISLTMEECDDDVLPVNYEISILDAKGVKQHKRDFKADFGKLNRMINSNTDAQYRLSWDYLTNPANGLLVKGSLMVHCELYVSGDIQQHSIERQSKLSKDFSLLLENGKFADVSLFVDKKEFKAHKNVLAARSPVFCAMFEHTNTKESQESRVDIEDMSVEVFELLLRFIYTEKIDSLAQYAPELLQAADRYLVDSLKSKCEHYIGSSLTVDTVASVAILADNPSSTTIFKEKCIKYLIKHACDVVDTDGWKNLVVSHPELACRLFKVMLKKGK